MNTEIKKLPSTSILLTKWNLYLVGTVSGWEVMHSEGIRFVNKSFTSLGSLEKWSTEYLDKYNSERQKENQPAPPKGGSQSTLF